MYYDHDPKFPEGFLWGASSAAWQVEGAASEGGRCPSNIDLNSKKKKPFADNSIAADHYHRYKEDVALMAECGFTSYRFSIAWPRIVTGPGHQVNSEGIAFYNSLIDELVSHGITLIVTLYHYDLPCWVDEVYGNWLGTDKGCTNWFEEQWQINHIMNLCHAKAVIACHEMVEGGKIGPVPGMVPIYPETCKPEDQIGAMNAEEFTEKALQIC